MICAVSLSRLDSAVTPAHAISVFPDIVVRETLYRLQGPCAWQTFTADFAIEPINFRDLGPLGLLGNRKSNFSLNPMRKTRSLACGIPNVSALRGFQHNWYPVLSLAY